MKMKPLFKASVPNLNDYIGRSVVVQDVTWVNGKRTVLSEEKVVIASIVGNRFKQLYLEINGRHLISALRFFAQMNGDKSITEELFQAFESTEHHAEKLKDEHT